MANIVTGSSTTVTSFSGSTGKPTSSGSSSPEKPIDSSNQPGWGAVKGEKPAETTYGGVPGSGGTYTSKIKNIQGGYDPISKQEAIRQGVVQTEQQRQANLQVIGYGASQRAIEERHAREDAIKKLPYTQEYKARILSDTEEQRERKEYMLTSGTASWEEKSAQEAYNIAAIKNKDIAVGSIRPIKPSDIGVESKQYDTKGNKIVVPDVDIVIPTKEPTQFKYYPSQKGSIAEQYKIEKEEKWLPEPITGTIPTPKPVAPHFDIQPESEALIGARARATEELQFSEALQTKYEKGIGYDEKTSGVGKTLLAGAGQFVTSIPAFVSQAEFDVVAVATEPKKVITGLPKGVAMFGTQMAEHIAENPVKFTGMVVGGHVIMGGGVPKSIKNVATRIGEIKVGNRPTGLELLTQRSSVVAIVPKRQTQILELKPQFKSPLTGNYESAYNRQQVISDNKIMIKQLTELGKIQTKRLSSQRSTSHTSLEKLSPGYKAKVESNLQKAKSMLEQKPITETGLDTKQIQSSKGILTTNQIQSSKGILTTNQIQSSKGILMTGIVSTPKSDTKQVQSPIQNTKSLNATELGLKQEQKQDQTMKPLTSEITVSDTRQVQSQAPILKLSTPQTITQKQELKQEQKQEVRYDNILKSPVKTTTRTKRTPKPKPPKKLIELPDSSDITSTRKSTRKQITSEDIMDEPTQVSPWYPASLENVTLEEMTTGKRARHIKEKSTSQKLFHKLRTQGVSIPTERQFKSRKLK